MASSLGQSWWLVSLRGVLALLFGLTAFAWSGPPIGSLVLLFGTYAFVDGFCAIALAIRVTADPWAGWPVFAEGTVSAAIGLLAWRSPAIPWAALYVIATWGIITGVLEILAAGRLHHETTSEWLFGLGGASSVVLGMLLLGLPGAGAAWMVRIIGGYALLFGVLLLGAGFHLHRLSPKPARRAVVYTLRRP